MQGRWKRNLKYLWHQCTEYIDAVHILKLIALVFLSLVVQNTNTNILISCPFYTGFQHVHACLCVHVLCIYCNIYMEGERERMFNFENSLPKQNDYIRVKKSIHPILLSRKDLYAGHAHLPLPFPCTDTSGTLPNRWISQNHQLGIHIHYQPRVISH